MVKATVERKVSGLGQAGVHWLDGTLTAVHKAWEVAVAGRAPSKGTPEAEAGGLQTHRGWAWDFPVPSYRCFHIVFRSNRAKQGEREVGAGTRNHSKGQLSAPMKVMRPWAALDRGFWNTEDDLPLLFLLLAFQRSKLWWNR